MKPILISMKDMSDSKEVYESRPNIFFSIFIYTILAMLMIAILWMSLGKIDIVVKSEGMIRPDNQVATVVNTYSGTISKVNVKDGAMVKEGDILYIIEHEDLLSELGYYKEQLDEVDKNLELLHKYKRSIEDGVNHFKTSEEEFFLKYQDFKINYDQMEKDLLFNDEEREIKLTTVTEQLDYLKNKLENIELLKKAVNESKNLFVNTGNQKEYYNLFMKYQSDYNSLVTQYENAKIDIDNSTTEEGLINSLDYYQEVLTGLKQLKASIINDKMLFDENNSYKLQYEEYKNKVADLTATYEQAKESYEINKKLEGLAVTQWEVQQSKAAAEQAERALDTFKINYMANINTSLTDTKAKIKELKLSKDNTISKDKLYKQNEKEKKAALSNFKVKYLVELDNTLASLRENIINLEANKKTLELQKEATLHYEGETEEIEANLFEYRNNELRATIESIDTYTNKRNELLANIKKIEYQIDTAIVKAAKSGVINSNIELVEGDILTSGTEVLTIIPEKSSEFKVNIYVSNRDIGKLTEGMKAKFNVYALPNSEYGYLTGTVTKISKDIKVDSENGSGYYLVEAKVDGKELYNEKGEVGKLKTGMTCQAQMITESKRILTFVLEKIELWIR